ncbi:potassium channel [Grosmannia clavigera kw1407]|uniref:Potassium channel n=1 Tax=Grosmannia clavigera (strain kw1407 / UAMH 11150) TaxID=655863 RepID=F0XMV1_GROCL|nr:potassium channel [Grosmannia clavigera kw1407]EFX01171.1 potassium channel [Grosmannia clavigera kw1407]
MLDASVDTATEHVDGPGSKEQNGDDEPYRIARLPTERAKSDAGADETQPSRWWFAATAFPMAAGTLGPVASAFSICALVRPWRQEIVAGTTIETAVFIDDPVWLTGINAVQLAIAVAANMSLLLNMARRIRFAVAQPVTMVGWSISALTLVALTATGAHPLRRGLGGRDVVWSQAFYYAIYAAVLYAVVASLMVATYVGAATGRYDKDFQLNNSQRTLMLQTILFLLYLLVGALVFSTIEDWAFLDAVYWADVTLFTVGFGDLAAQTTLGRALLFPYALVGIISLGLVIGSIRSLAVDRGKRRLDARMAEKNRRRCLRRLTRDGADDILQPITDAPAPLAELRRRETEFNLMRHIQHAAARRRRWLAVAMSGGTWLLLWLVGAYIFQTCEAPYQHWDYFDGFYLAFVSLTTIGYGDVTPMSNAGKSFFVFWSLLALPTTTVLISDAGDTIVKGISDATNAVGRITILPGEAGLKRDLKELVRALTFGAVFSDLDDDEDGDEDEDEEDSDVLPPGLLGAAQPRPEDRQEREEQREEDTEEMADEERRGDRDSEQRDDYDKGSTLATGSNAETAGGQPAPIDGQRRRHGRRRDLGYRLGTLSTLSMPRVDIPQRLPSTREAYHCMLADEIARVTQHMRHVPPRRYAFAEWAWFLKLVGEDERSAEMHGRARPTETTKRTETDSPDSDHTPWSWVGSRSPLMSGQEEAEWVLDRLTRRLQAELRQVETQQTSGDISAPQAIQEEV